MEEKARLHAMVEGSVQGVGFRQFVLMTAINLDLTGWVRNTFEGSVEVVAEGRQDILDTLLFALRQGPAPRLCHPRQLSIFTSQPR